MKLLEDKSYACSEKTAVVDFGDDSYVISCHDGREKVTLTGKCEIKIDALSDVMVEKIK